MLEYLVLIPYGKAKQLKADYEAMLAKAVLIPYGKAKLVSNIEEGDVIIVLIPYGKAKPVVEQKTYEEIRY